MTQKINVLGIDIDNVSMNEAVQICANSIQKGEKLFVVTANPELLLNCEKNSMIKHIVQDSDLIVADGVGVLIGSKIRGNKFKERVAGIDLMENLLKYANEHKKSVYLLGSKENVAQKAAENIKSKYNEIIIAGTHHGYYKGIHTGSKGNEEEVKVINDINKAKPDILFVAFGGPKQEIFIDTYLHNIDAKVFVGVGGSFDVYSGILKRAPAFYQKAGLEWLYRLIQEPQRIVRMSSLPKFIFKAAFYRKN